MKKFLALFLGFLFILNLNLKADEGMWLPLLVQKLNMQKMQEMGLKLSAEDIYSINNSSLKDAVVALDHGSCSGELISKDGLVLTNHHCGYGEIQAHSSTEHDYLTDGFWAMKREDELSNPGKTMSFLISIKEVTDEVLNGVSDDMDENARAALIKKNSDNLEANTPKAKDHYEIRIRPMFEGNQYFLFVYETFKDIRLVGAPPESIGKFGYDTDNWMWPRHTGDFSLFRIYCAPDGTPAEYSEENIPYTPKYHFPIALYGYEKDEFAMVMGYPGRTNRYLTSWGVDNEMELVNKTRVTVRTKKLDIMKHYMDQDNAIRIKYASKHARSANYWKYSIGQNKALKALDVVSLKQEQEAKLKKWIDADMARKDKYGEALLMIQSAHKELEISTKTQNYFNEAIFQGPEVVMQSFGMLELYKMLKGDRMEEAKQIAEELKAGADEFYKDFYMPIDKELMAELFKIYKDNVAPEHHPDLFKTIDSKYKGDFHKYAEKTYKKTLFATKDKYLAFLDNPSLKVLEKDPVFQAAISFLNIYQMLYAEMLPLENKLDKGRRLFIAAKMEMEKDKAHYPDANSTMRLTYGKVGDYSPRDAVRYNYYTSIDGYVQKEDPNNEEFFVTDHMKELIGKKDFGQYIDKKKNTLVTCFTTNNDITGGNSGSPVINGYGHLIGTAFDGNWESMSGDIAFENKLQKCINVDVRFTLWIIDKYAGAGHLVDEMTIIKRRPVTDIEITGTVTNYKDEPAAGVTVEIDGTETKVITDVDGMYKITVPEGTKELKFSGEELMPQMLEIGTEKQIDVKLEKMLEK